MANKTIVTYLKNNILLFVILFSFSISLKSQTVFCPPNINFENGNLINWRFYTGTCCPIAANTLSGATANRHVLTSGTSIDPYGGFPIVAPGGGSFSLKLGNDSTGNQAERARYYIHVPQGVNNYKLIFKYAVVFENPSDHSTSEQPRFTVTAYDSITNIILPCVNFNFVSNGLLPGFLLSPIRRTSDAPIYYRNWSSANLDLSGYGGKTLAIDFASGDCDLGGHFGYGYIDVDCNEFKASVISCKGNPISTLIGPNGFTEYKWYDSTFSTLLGSNQVLTITTPTYFNKFKLITKPYPTFGCADTITTLVRISDLNLNIQNDTLVCGGTPFQLYNTAAVSAYFQPITYSWSPPNGLSCTNCLNPIVSPPSTTKYILTTTDVNGCIQKDSFTVSLKINITSQPKNISLCIDSTAKFKVVVNGTIPFTYQWRKNGININGANSDSLIISNVGYNDTANYAVMISANCDSVLSTIVKLKILKPFFLKQPVNLLQCPGSRAVFKSTVTSDTNMVYQWYKRGILMPGANKDSLVLNNISNLDTGFYYLKVIGKCNYTISDTIKLTISNTTTITLQPSPISQCKNIPAIFKVNAFGPGILSYQWKKGNTNLLGQTKDSLVLNNMNYSDSGDYSVKIWSLCDTVISNIAKLTLYKNTTITNQPKNISACKDSIVKFKVSATGYGNITYQWKKNGQDIVGANRDSLIISNVNYNDSANYTVLVTSFCDSVISNSVKLKVFFPVFTKQPNNIIQCAGTRAVFKTTVTNDSNIVYKWYKNGLLIAGATKDSIVLNNISNADTGFYQLKATGKCTYNLSDTVYLSLYKNSSIIVQPQPITQCINTRAVFRIIAGGSGPFLYQWKRGTQNIIGQNADSLVINNINYSDTVNYSVNVSNLCNNVTSSVIKLSIFPNTKITVQPQSILQCVNSKAILKVKATGTGIITYQWLKNGISMLGATTDSLVINALRPIDSANYTVIVRSFCDSVVTNTARIDLLPFPEPNLPDTTLLCSGIAKITLNGFKSYLWNTGSINNYVNTPTNGIYWVKVENNNGCFNYDSTLVLLNSLPLLSAGNDTVICNQLILNLNASAINYDSILWENNLFGNFENDRLLATKFYPNANTTGLTTLVISAKNNCGKVTDDLIINYTPIPNADFKLSDTLVCEGAPKITITPTDSNGVFFGEHIFNYLFDPITNGIFTIQYQISRNFCSNSSIKTIEVIPQPIADFTYKSLVPDIDKEVQFFSNSKNENEYLWTFENNQTSPLKNTTFYFTEEGFYNVQLKAINRICSDTAIRILHIKGSKFIYMPNAFTPNQNGLNEDFKVVYKNSKGATLHIYNRWGQWLYTSNDLTKGWDGTFNGNPCQEDVYYYIVDYINNNGEANQLKGNFTLLR